MTAQPSNAAFRVGARRPPVLLLHGLTGAPADLQVISRRLRQAGYTVEVPMLPGHGVGERELLRTGWRDWLAAAESALLHLAGEDGRVVVGGLSMGGAVVGPGRAPSRADRGHSLLRPDPAL